MKILPYSYSMRYLTDSQVKQSPSKGVEELDFSFLYPYLPPVVECGQAQSKAYSTEEWRARELTCQNKRITGYKKKTFKVACGGRGTNARGYDSRGMRYLACNYLPCEP